MKSRGRRPQKLPLANHVEIAELAGVGIFALAEGHRGIVEFRQRLAHQLLEPFGIKRVTSAADARFPDGSAKRK